VDTVASECGLSLVLARDQSQHPRAAKADAHRRVDAGDELNIEELPKAAHDTFTPGKVRPSQWPSRRCHLSIVNSAASPELAYAE
jgi:hypothetical protein